METLTTHSIISHIDSLSIDHPGGLRLMVTAVADTIETDTLVAEVGSDSVSIQFPTHQLPFILTAYGRLGGVWSDNDHLTINTNGTAIVSVWSD